MKDRFILLLVALTFVSLIMTGCANKQEVVDVINQLQKESIENKWARDTINIREEGHEVFTDADLIGTVIERKEGEITISSIAREVNTEAVMTGAIMLGTGPEDEEAVKFSKNSIVQDFNVNSAQQTVELHEGSLHDVTIGSIVSLYGTYEDDGFAADKLIVWTLQE